MGPRSHNPSSKGISLIIGFALLAAEAAHAQSNSNCFNSLLPPTDRINACGQVIDSDSGHSQAYQARAAAWYQLQDYDRAITDYTQAIAIDPKYIQSFFGRGLSWERKGKLQNALDDFQYFVSVNPTPDALAAVARVNAAVEGQASTIAKSQGSPPSTVVTPTPTITLAEKRPAFAEKRIALVVGNSNYQNVPPLNNPANDARLMVDTLRSVGFAVVGNQAQLDLDKAGFDNAVRRFGRELQGADVGLFFYAGHGLQVRGANYLVPVNANPVREADLDFELEEVGLVLRQMEGAGTRLNIVFLDACRNNPFGGRGLRALESGLAQMRAPEGTLISFATQPGSVAQDGNDGHSPFTRALARTVRKPGLGIFDALNDVGLAVKSATAGAQQPWFSTSPINGAFYFVPPTGLGSGPPPVSNPATHITASPMAPKRPAMSKSASPAAITPLNTESNQPDPTAQGNEAIGHRSSASIECSRRADALALHGEERWRFRAECKNTLNAAAGH
jgi:Caspase domain/TPR repeat